MHQSNEEYFNLLVTTNDWPIINLEFVNYSQMGGLMDADC